MGTLNEKIIEKIELVLLMLFEDEVRGHWISVVDRPISKMISDAQLHKAYASVIMDELRKIGLIESEGQKAGMRYKIATKTYPDIKILARKIYKAQNEKVRAYQETRKHMGDGYPSSSSSDLRPKNPKKTKSINEFDNKSQVLRLSSVNIPHLNDMRYTVNDGLIFEGRVISVGFSDVNTKEIIVDIEHIRTNPEGGEPLYFKRRGVTLSKLFLTPQDAANYLVNKCVRYIKRK